MHRRVGCVMIVLLLTACATGWAQDAVQVYRLQYAPAVGESQDSAVLGKLADLLMNDTSLGLTGQVAGTMKQSVTKVDAETGAFTTHIAFEDLEAEFAEQPRDPRPLPAADITISQLGQVLKLEREGGVEARTAPSGLGDIDSGGVPLDMVAFMAAWVRFSEDPIAVGESWTLEEKLEFPVVGETTVTTVTKLVAIDGSIAKLESHMSSDVPAFEMDNPLSEGKLTVESGKIIAEGIQREFDMDRSLVIRAKGTLRIELTADLGLGMPTPIALVAEFSLSPPEPETEPDADAPDADAANPDAGARVGPWTARAYREDGRMVLALTLDLSDARLPQGMDQYEALVQLSRLACSISAGVRGEELGRMTLSGHIQAGPLATRRELNVDFAQMSDKVAALLAGVFSRR